MTIEEKRAAYRAALLSREKKNRYSLAADKRLLVEEGYGDCSSTPYYWLKKLFGMDIGDYTQAQLLSPLGQKVHTEIQNGIPREKDLEVGDHLYFRGNDASRTQGVGHVEIYIGNGQCFGHSSGTGGTVKDMAAYCARRQATPSRSSALKNKGLICVIRFLHEENAEDFGSSAAADTPVVRFQGWLNRYVRDCLPAPLELDGSCGPKTRQAAVMAMQRFLNDDCQESLAIDGSFGPASRRAYRTVYRGVRGTHAWIVQGLLYGHGLDPQGLDGSCGPGCEEAIRQYQARQGLEVDGRCGPATFSSLARR